MSTPYEEALARIVANNAGRVVNFALATLSEQERAAFLAEMRPPPQEERARLRQCITLLEGLLNPQRYDEIKAAIQTIHDSIEVPADES